MNERRRVLAAVGAALGVAGAVAALVLTPVLALVSALGGLIAALAAWMDTPVDKSSVASTATASSSANDQLASQQPDEAAVHPVESPQLATAGAAGSPVPSSPRSDAGPAGQGSGPAAPASALTDPATGLFSQDYFDIAIDARIAAARRHLRPVGVVLLEVVEGMRVGRIQPTDPKRVAEAISETLREADTACRRTDGRFSLLLEDTPENGAIWTIERIRRFLADRDPTLTLWAGVACYPAHGFSSDALVELASSALDTAREWHQDRIEVAVSD